MDRAFGPDSFAQNRLLQKVEEAQLLGRDCFLRSPGHEVAVHIRPGDSAPLSLEALQLAGDDLNFAAVEFSYRPLAASLEGGAFVLNGRGEVKPGQFADFFALHPLESLASIRELAQSFDTHFGSGSDWRVYSGFLQALPAELSDATLQKLVVPLLAAGELNFIPTEAEEVLQKRGWSQERIQAAFSEDERNQRSAKQYFLEKTGVPIDEVRTANDLFVAIGETLIEHGNFYAVQLISDFITAHHFTTDTDALEKVIFPFLQSFGPEGYAAIIASLDACEHAGSWNAPAYSGPALPHFGRELGGA